MKVTASLTLLLITLLITGCNSSPVSPASPTTPLPYPGPTGALPVGGVVRFQIDRPVKAGATLVKGSGPVGVPIIITNVTTMGEILGGTVIGTDHRFEVEVAPLQSNIRIGLEIGDLTGTPFVWEQFQANGYKGDGALVVPLVGYYPDTVVVQQ